MADNKKSNQPGNVARDEFDEDEVFKAPVIVREPTSRQAKIGSRVVLRITATGRPLPAYQWYHNGSKIAGANTDRLTLTKVRRSAIGNYHCEAKNVVGRAVSRDCMLSLFQERLEQITIGPKELKAEAGKPFTLKVLTPDEAALQGLTIYWVFNGMRIKDAHGLELSISAAKKKYEGEYKAVVSAGSGLETSNVAKVLVVPARAEGGAQSQLTPPPLPNLNAAGTQATPPPLPTPKPAGWDDALFNPEEEDATPTETPAPLAEHMPGALDLLCFAEGEVLPQPDSTLSPGEISCVKTNPGLLRKQEFLEDFLSRWQKHCAKTAADQSRRTKAA